MQGEERPKVGDTRVTGEALVLKRRGAFQGPRSFEATGRVREIQEMTMTDYNAPKRLISYPGRIQTVTTP